MSVQPAGRSQPGQLRPLSRRAMARANAANGVGAVMTALSTRVFCTRVRVSGSTFAGSFRMVVTMIRVCSVPMVPAASAAASSGNAGSVSPNPVAFRRGRTAVAVAACTRARASGAEIVNACRSNAAVQVSPWEPARFRVLISPASWTCAVYTSGGLLVGLRQRQQVPVQQVPEFRFPHPDRGGACGPGDGPRLAGIGVHVHTQNPRPGHRQSACAKGSRTRDEGTPPALLGQIGRSRTT